MTLTILSVLLGALGIIIGVCGDIDAPAFTVAQTSHVSLHNATTIPFNKVITAYGRHSVIGGAFIAQLDGVYKFQVYALTKSDTSLWLELYKNSDLVSSIYGHTSGDYADAGNAVILELAVGDSVRIVSRDKYDVDLYGTTSGVYTTFSGVYIGDTEAAQSGEVVAFSLALDEHQYVAAGTNVIFDKVILDYQNAYNNNTGVFTAPSPGIYIFHFFALSRQNAVIWQDLYRNNEYVCAIYNVADSEYADAGNTVLLHLNVGDQITLRANDNQNNNIYGGYDEVYSSFSGAMLHADGDFVAGHMPTAFSVGLVSDQTVADGATVVFNKVITDLSGAYNRVTGNFVAPVPGIYEFNYHSLGQKGQAIWLELYKNNVYIDSLYSHTPNHYAVGGNAVVLRLNAADMVYVKAHGSNMLYGRPNSIYCTFSGYLAYPTQGGSGGIVGK